MFAATLFSKQLISMQYHEVAGLILIGLVVVHIVINIKTASAMCKKFLKDPAAIKTGLVVDILLLLCFALVGISGVLISHTILTGISSDNVIYKMLHMFGGGLSVILLGVHIGLHICRKPLPVVAAVVVTAVVLCGGIYGTVNSSEVRWLSSPLTFSSQSGGGSEHTSPDNDSDKTSGNKAQANVQDETHQSSERQSGQVQSGQSANSGGKNRQPLPFPQKVQNIIMFLGMILSCTMITYWIAVPKKKKTDVPSAWARQTKSTNCAKFPKSE